MACELAFIIWNHLEEHRDWSEAQSSGEIPFPSKPNKTKLILEMASVALVVFGIVGELRVDAKLGDLDTDIQRTNEDRAAHLQYEADSAETAAAKAQCSANKAGSDAGIANARVRAASGSALQAQRHATEIGEELDKEMAREQVAEQQLETEKDKRLKLAASLLPRKMFDQSGPIDKLLSLPARRVVLIYADAQESRQFAEQIAFVFSQLKWPFAGHPVPEDDLEAGVAVTHGDRTSEDNLMLKQQEWNDAEAFSENLRQVLKDAHVDLSEHQRIWNLEGYPLSTVIIGIGPKLDTELLESLNELGAPKPTPLTRNHGRMWENRISIPLDTPASPYSGKP